MSESLAINDDESSQEDEQSRKAKQLPQPRGYKILIALPEPEEKTAGGILKATETLHNEEIILMRSYSGTRFKVHDKEFRLINDDSVEAVVEDPRGIVKV